MAGKNEAGAPAECKVAKNTFAKCTIAKCKVAKYTCKIHFCNMYLQKYCIATNIDVLA